MATALQAVFASTALSTRNSSPSLKMPPPLPPKLPVHVALQAVLSSTLVLISVSVTPGYENMPPPAPGPLSPSLGLLFAVPFRMVTCMIAAVMVVPLTSPTVTTDRPGVSLEHWLPLVAPPPSTIGPGLLASWLRVRSSSILIC